MNISMYYFLFYFILFILRENFPRKLLFVENGPLKMLFRHSQLYINVIGPIEMASYGASDIWETIGFK